MGRCFQGIVKLSKDFKQRSSTIRYLFCKNGKIHLTLTSSRNSFYRSSTLQLPFIDFLVTSLLHGMPVLTELLTFPLQSLQYLKIIFLQEHLISHLSNQTSCITLHCLKGPKALLNLDLKLHFQN